MNKPTFKQVWLDIIQEIQTGLENIDESQVNAVIRELGRANRIFCVGAGRSKSILRSFCIRLNHIGLEAYEVGGIPCPPITPNDILVASTGSGSTVTVLAILRRAKEEGAKIIVFTANNNEEIRSLADIIISITAPSGLLNTEDNRSKQLMRTLFEQIAFILQESMIAILSYRMPLEQIVKRHANLE